MFSWSVHGTNKHAYLSGLFVIHFIFLLIFCDVGRANIVVYEGSNKIKEFIDVELPYTGPIDRNGIEGLLVSAYPLDACVNISRPPNLNLSMNWFVLIAESSCSFETKIINAKVAGYSAAIIYTYNGRIEGFNSQHRHNRIYSHLPTVIINTEDGIALKENYLYTETKQFRIVIVPRNVFAIIMGFLLLFSIIAGLFLLVLLTFTVIRFFQQVHTTHNGCLRSQHLRQLQTTIFHIGDHYETCAICLEDYKDQDELRILPCSHGYHTKCIDPWLTNNRRICPVCKRKVILIVGPSMNANSNFDENSPLIHATRTDTHGTFNYENDTPLNLDCNLPRNLVCTRNMQPSTSAIIPPDTSQER